MGYEDEMFDAQKCFEELDLTESGKWLMGILMANTQIDIQKYRQHWQMAMSLMYDLSKNRDESKRVDNIRKLALMQAQAIGRMFESLTADISDPTSGFHYPGRKQHSEALHKLHRLSQDGVDLRTAAEDVIKQTVTDADQRRAMLTPAARQEIISMFDKDTMSRILGFLKGLHDEHDIDDG
jgi:hypothetical protein